MVDLSKRRLVRHKRQLQAKDIPTAPFVERLLFGDNQRAADDDDDDDDGDSTSSYSASNGDVHKASGSSSTKSSNDSGSSSTSSVDNGNSDAYSTSKNNDEGASSTSSNDGYGQSTSSYNDGSYTSSSSSSSTSTSSSTRSSTSSSQTSSSTTDADTSTSSSSSLSSSSSSSSSRDRSSSSSATSTTSQQASTSTSSSSLSPSSSSTTASAVAAAVTTAATSGSLTTSVQLVTSTGTGSSAAATTSTKSSSSVSVGPIIGIVAAALAGTVIIGALIGFLIKKFKKKEVDPFETDPFDRDEFRRQSAMLPDGFDSDDGHPSMADAHSFSNLASLAGIPHHDNGNNFVPSASMANDIYGGASGYSHNENGGPRPPTMIMRHAGAHGSGNAGPVPSMPASMFPNGLQMPGMAYGGADPYAAAGVSANQQNVVNPYAHLDRAPSSASQNYGYAAGAATALERSGSDNSLRHAQGSQGHQGFSFDDQAANGHDDDEGGRSGTPDIPNVQQTYALGSENGHHSPASRQSAGFDMYEQYQHSQPMGNPHDGLAEQYDGYAGGSAHSPPAALQVRNLTNSASQPYSLSHHHQQPSQAYEADDTIYAGVY